jgi:hypothetical protein
MAAERSRSKWAEFGIQFLLAVLASAAGVIAKTYFTLAYWQMPNGTFLHSIAYMGMGILIFMAPGVLIIAGLVGALVGLRGIKNGLTRLKASIYGILISFAISFFGFVYFFSIT